MTELNTNEEHLQNPEPCLVKVQLFEGPLDLLLHLIKKNEVDIYDIPIAKITEQYIEYLEFMKVLNLQFAGEYLVIAAELSLIKSKMLLPKPVIEEEEEDPRAELVRRLIEYQVYKDAATDLVSGDILGRDVFKRDYIDTTFETSEEVELIPVDMWSLIEAFREFYKRRSYLWAEEIEFEAETISIEDKIEQLTIRLQTSPQIRFEDLFDDCSSKFDLVITFLALLELSRTDNIEVAQESPDSSILISYMGESEVGSF
ncbi:MAG: segregation/condensation protein A [Thermodesulfobacteriota bacterium]